MDADAQANASVGFDRGFSFALSDASLHGDRAFDRVDRALELEEHPVALGFHIRP